MPVSVDIVLPCFNPNDSWPHELLLAHDVLKTKCLVNYIIVNDGSEPTKINQQISFLKEKNIPLDFISYDPNMGKGYALRSGIAFSKAKFFVYTDLDFPFTDQSMLNVLEALNTEQYDIVVGYRNESYYDKKMSLFRKLLSKAFRFFVRKILKMPVTDTQCGLKGFNKNGKELFLKTNINRYLFDFEFIYAACKIKSLRLLPVQVQLKENVVFSKMKLKILIQELFNLIRILLFKPTK